jgi:hypothetical protein
MSDKCSACSRVKKYFEGCCIVECPERKPITAQPATFVQTVENIIAYADSGCTFKIPSNHEE